jgi:SAM-dependent methyltransferase
MQNVTENLFGPFAVIHSMNLPGMCLTLPFEGLLGVLYTKAVGAAKLDSAWFADRVGSTPREVLDLCCGGGRSAIETARRGHRVLGVDVSDTQLSIARAATSGLDPVHAANITWLQGDARSLELDRTFDCVVIGGLSITLFEDAVRTSVLRTVRRHLRPGGVFLFDYIPALIGEAASEHVLACPVKSGSRSGFVLVGSRKMPAKRLQYTNMYAELIGPAGQTQRILTGFRFRLDDPRALTTNLSAWGFTVAARHRISAPTGSSLSAPASTHDYVLAELHS